MATVGVMRPVERRIVPLLVGAVLLLAGPGFISGPSPAAPRADRLARRAEVVDVELEDEDVTDEDEDEEEEDVEEPWGRAGNLPSTEQIASVMDGYLPDKSYKEYERRLYHIKKTKNFWTDNAGVKHPIYTYFRFDDEATGEWCDNYTIPDFAYKHDYPKIKRRFMARLKRLKKTFGNNKRYPNGRFVYLENCDDCMRNELYPEYNAKADWYYFPWEKEANEQKARAEQLRLQMALKTEAERLEYLREIGVWPGESEWRMPRELQQVPIKPPSVKAKEAQQKRQTYDD